MWHPIHQHMSQAPSFASRDIETAGILQGLRTPGNQALELEMDANVAAIQQQQMFQAAAGGATIEPTLLQPPEWFGPYAGIGNWLMVDWDQGFGW
jgi:hypothetical protein